MGIGYLSNYSFTATLWFTVFPEIPPKIWCTESVFHYTLDFIPMGCSWRSLNIYPRTKISSKPCCTISGKIIAPSHIFQGLLTWKRKDMRRESILLSRKMQQIFIESIFVLLYCTISFRSLVLNVWNKWKGAIPLPLMVPNFAFNLIFPKSISAFQNTISKDFPFYFFFVILKYNYYSLRMRNFDGLCDMSESL